MKTQTEKTELEKEIESILEDIGLPFTQTDGIFEVFDPTFNGDSYDHAK